MSRYREYLDILKKEAIKEGFAVRLSVDEVSYISWQEGSLNIPKEIGIEKILDTESKVYFFLHEMGHHNLRKDWNSFTETFPTLSYAEEQDILFRVTKYLRRISYKVSLLNEEYKAWDEGFLLAGKLGIEVNMEKWVKIRDKSLMAYIKYYSNK